MPRRSKRAGRVAVGPVELDTQERIEALERALGTARDRIQELSAQLGKRASRRGRQARHASAEAARTAVEQARAASELLPPWDELVERTRRAGDQLFRERAKARRKAQRKRRRGLAYRLAGVAGVGLAIGWLTAPRRGPAAEQVERMRGQGPAGGPLDARSDAAPPAEVPLVQRADVTSNGPRSH